MATQPNILLITVHDLGTHLGCYGANDVASPNLDRLAAAGVRFTNHFATACFCSPSRGSIVTGKWPHVNGLMGLVNLGWDLSPENRTLARVLGDGGYETFLFGHQHEVKDPSQLGFQAVCPCASQRCADVAPQVAEFLAQRAGKPAPPFYLRVGFSEVHRVVSGYESYEAEGPAPAAVSVPPYLEDTPGARQDLAGFAGCIRHMDAAVGRILDALDVAGLGDNTLLVFTTDHGIAFPRAKATLYDPGIHTTLLLRWPAKIAGARVQDELLSNIDLFPTLVEAAGAPLPSGVNGRSFFGLLAGEEYEQNEAVFAEKNTQPNDIKRAIRTERWKYIRNLDPGPLLSLPTDTEASLTRRDMGNAHLAPRPSHELYDLRNDPNERENLAGGAEMAAVERELDARLQKWMETTADPALCGPITRPPDEATLLDQARQRSQARRPSPRCSTVPSTTSNHV